MAKQELRRGPMTALPTVEHLIDCAVLIAKLNKVPFTKDTRIEFHEEEPPWETEEDREYRKKGPPPGTVHREVKVPLFEQETHSGHKFRMGYSFELDTLLVVVR